MNLYDGGFLVLYAMFLGESVMHWTQNWVFVTLFLLGLVDLMVCSRFAVYISVSFPATTLLCFTRLDYFCFLHAALLTLCPATKSGNGNLVWVFLGRALEKNLGWWNKTKKGMEIH